MLDTISYDRLIGSLTADLTPVKPLRAFFALRAALWLGMVGAAAGVLALFADLPMVAVRMSHGPDMWLAMSGAALTAVLGAIAAFQLSLPDRNPRWALLPLPALVLWLGASGLGCLRSVVEMGVFEHIWGEVSHCLMFILWISVPLSLALLVMLRRGYSLWPNLTGLVAGIAVAGACVALLNLAHPHDPSVISIAVHGLGIVIVMIINRLTGGWIFAANSSAPFSPNQAKKN